MTGLIRKRTQIHYTAPLWTPADNLPDYWFDASDVNTLLMERTGAAATTHTNPRDTLAYLGSWKNKGSVGGYAIANSDAARPRLFSDHDWNDPLFWIANNNGYLALDTPITIQENMLVAFATSHRYSKYGNNTIPLTGATQYALSWTSTVGLLTSRLGNTAATGVTNTNQPNQCIFVCYRNATRTIIRMNGVEIVNEAASSVTGTLTQLFTTTTKNRMYQMIVYLGDAEALIPNIESYLTRKSTIKASTRVVPKPLFKSDCVWYTQIPSDAPTHTDQTALQTQFNTYVNVTGTVNIYTSEVNYYNVPAGANTYDVYEIPIGNLYLHPNEWDAVPVPDCQSLFGVTSADKEIILNDPTNDTYFEFWNFNPINHKTRTYGARWGGKMPMVSNGCGIWASSTGTWANAKTGMTATGIPIAPLAITPEEMQAGLIEHVMGIVCYNAKYNTWVWPAMRCDGTDSNSVIKQGQRMVFDPSIDADEMATTRKLSVEAKAVLVAGQQYGFVVFDKNLSGLSVIALGKGSYADVGLPWSWPFDDQSWDVISNLPWNQMKFLPDEYGKPSASLSVTPTTVASGGTVSLSVRNYFQRDKDSRIGLFHPGDPSDFGHLLYYFWTDGTASGGTARYFINEKDYTNIPINVSAGTYEFRLLGSGYTLHATSETLTVT